jgi:hypothetical protein
VYPDGDFRGVKTETVGSAAAAASDLPSCQPRWSALTVFLAASGVAGVGLDAAGPAVGGSGIPDPVAAPVGAAPPVAAQVNRPCLNSGWPKPVLLPGADGGAGAAAGGELRN